MPPWSSKLKVDLRLPPENAAKQTSSSPNTGEKKQQTLELSCLNPLYVQRSSIIRHTQHHLQAIGNGGILETSKEHTSNDTVRQARNQGREATHER